ncbi:hypothetical protein OQA88_8398 [Cercophora sp. LCS_1]
MSSPPMPSPPRGTYALPVPTDTRGPCPMLNTLANHGYISRTGRNVLASDITTALQDILGVSWLITFFFTHPIFFTRRDPTTSLWSTICRFPFRFGMRNANQTDPVTKKPCLDLDQLGTPGAIEHDISLTRRDRAQGDCITLQQDLVDDLLAASSDGKTLSVEDLAGFRKRRIEEQTEVNSHVKYGRVEHSFACMEIALLLGVFGDGRRVRCDFARAFMKEERIPVQEGWVKRGWWRRLGVIELLWTSRRVRKAVGKVDGL